MNITGKITNEQGVPLQGAVVNVGKVNATTDVNGDYTLDVNGSDKTVTANYTGLLPQTQNIWSTNGSNNFVLTSQSSSSKWIFIVLGLALIGFGIFYKYKKNGKVK